MKIPKSKRKTVISFGNSIIYHFFLNVNGLNEKKSLNAFKIKDFLKKQRGKPIFAYRV
jgi:hypothetical protein